MISPVAGHNVVEPPKPNELYHGSVTPNIVVITVPGGVTGPTAQPGTGTGLGMIYNTLLLVGFLPVNSLTKLS